MRPAARDAALRAVQPHGAHGVVPPLGLRAFRAALFKAACEPSSVVSVHVDKFRFYRVLNRVGVLFTEFRNLTFEPRFAMCNEEVFELHRRLREEYAFCLFSLDGI